MGYASSMFAEPVGYSSSQSLYNPKPQTPLACGLKI